MTVRSEGGARGGTLRLAILVVGLLSTGFVHERMDTTRGVEEAELALPRPHVAKLLSLVRILPDRADLEPLLAELDIQEANASASAVRPGVWRAMPKTCSCASTTSARGPRNSSTWW